MKKLRAWLVVSLVACVLIFIIAVSLSYRSWPESMLSGASLIVSAATITSVIFALFSFYEYKELSHRVTDLHAVVVEKRDSLQEEIATVRSDLFRSAELLYSDICSALYSNPSTEEALATALHQLSLSMAKLGIDSRSPNRVEVALNSLFKHDKAMFLTYEGKVIEATASMDRQDKSRILQQYSTLRDVIAKEYENLRRQSKEKPRA